MNGTPNKKKKHSHELIDIFCLQRKKNLLLPYYNLQKIFTAVMKNFARNNVSNKYPYDYFMCKSTCFFFEDLKNLHKF